MKTYLNSQEAFDITKLIKFTSELETLVADWDNRQNLTGEERKNLRTSISFLLKSWKSICERVENSSLEKVIKRGEKMEIYFLDKFQKDRLNTNIQLKVTEMYEDKIYDLVEIAMYTSCANCKKHCGKCLWYPQFIERMVPEPTGEDYEGKKCKYGYYDEGRINASS